MRALLRRLMTKLFASVDDELQSIRFSMGQLASKRIRSEDVKNIRDTEFRAFSQWGEDGIIQFLISRVPIPNRSFIEFGVESYRESNTRFLMMNDHWRGLIIDGGAEHVRYLRQSGLMWKYDITAVSAFITRENINHLIGSASFQGDIGLLSVDLDGNDYWIWEAIDVVSPRILIVEYNSIFGAELPLSIPYRSDFRRNSAHFSNLYFGASIAAFCELASRKNYIFVGSNLAGSNAFFVRKDVAGGLVEVSARDGWVESRFRESRNERGELDYLAGTQRLKRIQHLPLVHTTSLRTDSIQNWFSLQSEN